MQFTPLGPWGVGASAGPATEGLKGLSGRVQNPSPLEGDQGGKRVKYHTAECFIILLYMLNICSHIYMYMYRMVQQC